ncbi:hypothetical protein ES708_00709 [subsurface metagenome]
MKAPAFQMYASDIYMDTVEWSVDELGIYDRLLYAQWVNGSIPNDITRLARIAGCGTKKFQKGWRIISFKFVPVGDGRLQNKRLEKTRLKQDNYRELQREAGRRGAEKRWGKDSNPNSNPNGDPINNPNDETMPLQSSSLKNKEAKAGKPAHFTNRILDKGYPPELPQQINELCKDLSGDKFNPWQWVQKNSKEHPKALLCVLERMKKEWSMIKSPWPYAQKVIAVEGQNYNEQDAMETHEALMKEFEEWELE